MTLYLDTEFNGHGGELISLALVSDKSGVVDFAGSFLASRKLPDGRYQCGRFTVLPAPNRYRKMISDDGYVSSWGGGSYDNAAVIKRQTDEYPYAKPIGIEFDLFDCYLAWESGGSEFYSVLPAPEKWDDWCLKHVVPFLEQASEPEDEFRMRLRHFLEQHSGEEIIADWPDDFVHLMKALSGPSYDQSYMLPVSLRLVVSGDVQPEIPHNALSDAKALMNWHLHHKSHIEK